MMTMIIKMTISLGCGTITMFVFVHHGVNTAITYKHRQKHQEQTGTVSLHRITPQPYEIYPNIQDYRDIRTGTIQTLLNSYAAGPLKTAA